MLGTYNVCVYKYYITISMILLYAAYKLWYNYIICIKNSIKENFQMCDYNILYLNVYAKESRKTRKATLIQQTNKYKMNFFSIKLKFHI